MAVTDLLQSEQFQNLSIPEQLKYLRENSDVFRGYNAKDQGKILYQAKQDHLDSKGRGTNLGTVQSPKGDVIQEPSQTEQNISRGLQGFSQTFGMDPMQVGKPPSIKDVLTDPHTYLGPASYVPGMISGLWDTGKEAINDVRTGDYAHLAGTGLGFGAQALLGAKGGEFARSGELGPVSAPTKIAGKTFEGAYKGVRDTPITYPWYKGLAGETAAHMIDPSLKGLGFGAGVVSDKIIGGIKGAGKGLVEGTREAINGPKKVVPTRFDPFNEKNLTNRNPIFDEHMDNTPITKSNFKAIVKEPFPEGKSFERNPNIAKKFKLEESSGKTGDTPKSTSKKLKVDSPNKIISKLKALPSDEEGFLKLPSSEPEPTIHDYSDTLKPEYSKNLKVNDVRSIPGDRTETLREVPIEKIWPDKGNAISEDKVKEYQDNPSDVHPRLRAHDENPGDFIVDEGHHRITAGVRNGKVNVLAWTPNDD